MGHKKFLELLLAKNLGFKMLPLAKKMRTGGRRGVAGGWRWRRGGRSKQRLLSEEAPQASAGPRPTLSTLVALHNTAKPNTERAFLILNILLTYFQVTFEVYEL